VAYWPKAEGAALKQGVSWRTLVIASFLVFMIVPLLATALFSISTRWDRSIWPEGITLAWWGKVVARPAFRDTLMNSLALSIATVVASLALITPTAYWAHLRVPAAKVWIELLAIVPFALPGVILAMGLIRFYSNVPLPIINTPNILVAAYVVLTLPFMYRSVANSLEAIEARSLDEAARSLGAGHWRTLLFVILPNIVPGVVNGSLLVFSTVFAEFTLANLLTGTRFKTFPIYLVDFTRFDARQASALAVISFVFAWLISLIILKLTASGGALRVAPMTR
jgi:putative spermidine/putrescine transport system permease protein